MDEILLQKELKDRQYTFVFGIICIALCALFKTIAPMIFWVCWWFEGYAVSVCILYGKFLGKMGVKI